jgi:hypothetical protein
MNITEEGIQNLGKEIMDIFHKFTDPDFNLQKELQELGKPMVYMISLGNVIVGIVLAFFGLKFFKLFLALFGFIALFCLTMVLTINTNTNIPILIISNRSFSYTSFLRQPSGS